MTTRSAIRPSDLHDVRVGGHSCAGDELSRPEAREGLLRLFRGRRRSRIGELRTLRVHQHHLTVPSLRVNLTQGGFA